MLKLVILVLIITPYLGYSQEVIDINLDIEHSVNGISEFDRAKYIILHAGINDNEWPNDQMKDQFLTDYDVYLGRNNGSLPWVLSQTEEDPNKPGWPSVSDLEQEGQKTKDNYANNTSLHKYESRIARYMMGGQEFMYPTPNNEIGPNGKKWTMIKDGYKPLAEYYAQYFKNFFGNGGTSGQPFPTYIEIMNEPFVKANKLGTTRENLTEMHNVIAKRIKELNPEAKIGGYSAAHPAYEANNNNFAHWEGNWKLFIDKAAENMDFLSLHLYDNIQHDQGQYRAGSNVEAILDMVEHYQMIKLGKRKPFCLSEYGNLNTEGELYTKERDWDNLRSFNNMIMQFLERPDIIEQALPFMILQANWWKPNPDKGQHPDAKYAHRLLRQKKELEGETGDEWVYTELVKFFQLWSNVKGKRIDAKSSNLDIQVNSYVDANKAYVIINNLLEQSRTIDLTTNGLGDAKIESILIKHLHAENARVPNLDETTVTNLNRVSIGKQATVVLEYTFDKTLEVPETSEEKKYFATTYNQIIDANKDISFAINNVDVSSTYGEAMLRIGMGRLHGKSLKPILKVNGTVVEVPDNWRGNDQGSRDTFFGVLEVEVPYNLLQTNNTITLNYPDAGGRVSSLAMQVKGFSKQITRSKEQFRLAQNNFSIQTSGESCRDTNNGKLTITALKNFDYIATLSGNNTNKNFTQSTSFENLAPGDYELCIVIPSQQNYEQCFDVNIQEVEPLAVTSKISSDKKTITYNLEGSGSYTIDFNGERFTTKESSIELSLQKGSNSIEIKTEKECQGKFKDTLFFNEIVGYPNPFNRDLTIDLGLDSSGTVRLYNTLGVLVYEKAHNPLNHKIHLDTNFLKEGIYVLSVKTPSSVKNIRAIKILK